MIICFRMGGKSFLYILKVHNPHMAVMQSLFSFLLSSFFYICNKLIVEICMYTVIKIFIRLLILMMSFLINIFCDETLKSCCKLYVLG